MTHRARLGGRSTVGRLVCLLCTALVATLGVAGGLRAPLTAAAAGPTTYYLHGTTSDEANKAAFTPSATFDSSAPTSTSPVGITQSAAWPNDGPNFAESAFDNFWGGSFKGALSGSVTFDWYWSSADPAAVASGANVVVTLFADPAFGTAAGEIGQAHVTLAVGAAPTENHTTVPLGKGATTCPCAVNSQLLIEVSTTDLDPNGAEVTAHYDSTAAPSSFTVTPVAAPTPAPTASASPTPTPTGGGGANVVDTNPSTEVGYAGTQEATSPTTEPQNAPSTTFGAPLVLQASLTPREAGEPSIGIDPKGTVFFPGDTFDTPGGALARNLEYRSADGGLTWQDVTPNVAGENTHPFSLDTITYVDKQYGRVFTMDTTAAGGSVFSFSDDEGATWTTTDAYAAGVQDHESITTGVVPAGSPLVTLDSAFPKLVYYCVNTVVELSCSRSLDGGRTFTQINSPLPTHESNGALCSSLVGHPATDSKGDLFIAADFNEGGGCGNLRMAVSTDAGNTWTDYPITTIKDDFNDLGWATDSAGNVYVVWQDDKFNLPYLSVSRDHGQTWSTPVMVAPPGVAVANFPALDAGDAGRIVITFPGSTDATANTDGKSAPWSYYFVLSNDALDATPHFDAEAVQIPGQSVSTTTMHRGACNGRCGGLFDFLDAKVAPTAGGPAWASLSDDCTGACVTSPTGTSNDPSAGAGIAIRELAGPAQTGLAANLPGPVPSTPESPLAALMLLAGAGLAAAGAALRRRRSPRPFA